MPTRYNRCFLLKTLLLAQHVSGTIMSIIRSSRVLYSWLLPVFCCPQTGHTTLSSTPYRQLENQAPKTTGSKQLYNTLELLMMGIMVPETCWASNKICNKKHMLHLVGILFPRKKVSHRYWSTVLTLNILLTLHFTISPGSQTCLWKIVKHSCRIPLSHEQNAVDLYVVNTERNNE
jgi:hypothetical protein